MPTSTHNWIIAILAVLGSVFAAFVYLDNRFIDTSEIANDKNLFGMVAKELKSNDEFKAAVKGDRGESGQIPIGTIVPFPGSINNIPDGWYLCDGREIQVSLGKELYDVIGNAWGGRKGVYYHLPDLRGNFLRGVDHKSGNDPEAQERKEMFSGGNSGDEVGSVQESSTAMPKVKFHVANGGGHKHTYTNPEGHSKIGNFNNKGWEGTRHSAVGGAGEHQHSISGGDVETRPKNASVNWIIKYK